MAGLKIVFATPECAPWVKTGGLGDVAAALPHALAQAGHDIWVLMPSYRPLSDWGRLRGLWELPAHGAWPAGRLARQRRPGSFGLLLLDCPPLYQRPGGPYADEHGRDHPDNPRRAAYLSHVAALLGSAASPLPRWQADVVHANDWTCGLAPVYLRAWRDRAPGRTAASVMTIHNLAFQGVYPMDVAPQLDLPPGWTGIEGAEYWGQLSFMKAGLQAADAITTVSPTYAREIQGEALGCGLHGVLQARGGVLHGILNGIDETVWNPATDVHLPARYDAQHMAGKAVCKAALQQAMGLRADAVAPLFGLISRLTPQKGIDLVLAALPRLLERGAQLVVLGTGEPWLEAGLRDAATAHPQQVAVRIGYDEALAHRIEAGADCFLMPSRYEPCGLNQMYSQRYGTPPLVHATGGLADSVVDVAQGEAAAGFVIPAASSDALLLGLDAVFERWAEPPRWWRLQQAGMARHFAWERSAAEYGSVYQQAMKA